MTPNENPAPETRGEGLESLPIAAANIPPGPPPSKQVAAAATPDDGPPQPPRFPTELLPPIMRDVVRDVSRVLRVPESLTGCLALGTVSAAIGKGLTLASVPGATAPANLFIVVGAESGTGKSMAAKHVVGPIYEFESNPSNYAATPGPEAPLVDPEPVRLTCADTTSEALAELLMKNGECIASISSDARDVCDTVLGRYKKNGGTDESLLTKCFSIESHQTDRITRERIILREPCLAILWMVQPDKLEALFASRNLRESGLLPRFLSCQSRAVPQKIDRSQPPLDEMVKSAWGGLIPALLRTYRLSKEVRELTPTTEAMVLLDDQHEQVRLRRTGDLADVTSFSARWNEQAWRIAVCLHAARFGAEAHNHPVDGPTARTAIALVDFFVAELLEIVGGARRAARERQKMEVLALLRNKNGQPITATEVCRVRITRFAPEAHALLLELVKDGKLVWTDSKPPGGGHTTTRYQSPSTGSG